MKKILIKYIALIFGVLILIVLYLSTIGLETEKFNNQIRDKVYQKNNKLNLQLEKIKFTLDPLNFKVNAKTIGTKILFREKVIELKYVKIKVSLIALIKKKFVSTNLKISTKSILFKDLLSLIRTTNSSSELFFLEQFIKSGNLIADLELNFDKNGKIKQDFKINGLLRNGKIDLIKKNNFEKINFIFNLDGNILKLQDLNFTSNNINIISDTLKITKSNKNYIFEGTIKNKNSSLNLKLIKLIKLNYKKFNFKNINFDSKSNFSFKIDNKLRLKDLIINSEIQISNAEYVGINLFNKYLTAVNELIYFKNHKINATYKENNLSLKGVGKIKLEKEFDTIDYFITNKGSDFTLVSNILLSAISIKNQKSIKKFFPETNEIINLKDHKININLKENNLSLKGVGKIKLEKEFDTIDYFISKIINKYNFDIKLDINKTLLKIDHLNYKKGKNSNAQIRISSSYAKNDGLNLKEFSILSGNNKIILKNLLIDKENKIIKVDRVDLDYFDIEKKKNKYILQRDKKNNYKINGLTFNANSLISNLLKINDDKKSKIFKNDVNLIINLSEVYIDDENMVKSLKGKLSLKNNKIDQTNISALFNKNEKLIFTITTNNDEKITTLFSSRAKPLVKRYKFIKGYEEGYLEFYSSKKNEISKSTLKIYDFKLQEVPALTKILTLASLQGIADVLTGEGIRFKEFEMNFTNQENNINISEIYAIGPAISILMQGYIEKNKIVSLRGTLVPATTLNKIVGSIPILGKILVGSKTGEGVFGVSFKIKGTPDKLETTVNPIKTLTPRFITRTIEKMKQY